LYFIAACLVLLLTAMYAAITAAQKVAADDWDHPAPPPKTSKTQERFAKPISAKRNISQGILKKTVFNMPFTSVHFLLFYQMMKFHRMKKVFFFFPSLNSVFYKKTYSASEIPQAPAISLKTSGIPPGLPSKLALEAPKVEQVASNMFCLVTCCIHIDVSLLQYDCFILSFVINFFRKHLFQPLELHFQFRKVCMVSTA
jgi:hypothetical protein